MTDNVTINSINLALLKGVIARGARNDRYDACRFIASEVVCNEHSTVGDECWALHREYPGLVSVLIGQAFGSHVAVNGRHYSRGLIDQRSDKLLRECLGTHLDADDRRAVDPILPDLVARFVDIDLKFIPAINERTRACLSLNSDLLACLHWRNCLSH